MNPNLEDPSSYFEGVIVSSLLGAEWWQDTSSSLLKHVDERAALVLTIQEMETHPPSWDGGDATPVTQEASETAVRFLNLLPNNRELPKVAGDGEGNVILVWEPPHGNCLVTIEPNVLHMVNQPGSQAVEHIDNQPFDGVHFPVAILSAIPFK